MKSYKLWFAAIAVALTLVGCSDDNEDFDNFPLGGEKGLYVVNSGNYGYGNGSLSYIDLEDGKVENEVFQRANGMKLGDVAQSMTVNGTTGWIVVNNSSVIFAIDLDTNREVGRVDKGLVSPRNIYFVSSEKAYVTQLYDNRIAIVNPRSYSVTGYIEVPGMTPSTGSTEEIVFDGQYAYCNCWSYQTSVIKIDTATDKVVASVNVGLQPESLTFDSNHTLRVLTDGGWEGNPLGYEAPALVSVNPETMSVTSKIEMKKGESVSNLIATDGGKTLMWLNGMSVYRMSASSVTAPSEAYITADGWLTALTVDDATGDVYVGDALDYVQSGAVYRYKDGKLASTYRVGIIPNGFCWR